MKIVDANFILRYLLNDIEDQAKEAFLILNSSSVLLLNEVLAEIVYVLEKVYKIDRSRICNELIDLIESEMVVSDNNDVARFALTKYAESNLDFIDSLLCGYARIKNATVFTFDKKLLKVLKTL